MGKVNRPPSKRKATRRPMPDFRPERDAIMQKVELYSEVLPNGCRQWVASMNELGYADIWWAKKYWMAHRLVYCAHHGPFDPWLDVRHSCDNPSCVEITHLSIGTRSDNMRDSVDRKRSKNAKKTHCPKGHSYAEHGLEFVPGGKSKSYGTWRHCKVCTRARMRIRLGWPEDLAYSLPPQRLGYRPPEVIERGSQSNG